MQNYAGLMRNLFMKQIRNMDKLGTYCEENGRKNGRNRAKSQVGIWTNWGQIVKKMGEKWAELSKEPRVGRVKLQGQAPLPGCGGDFPVILPRRHLLPKLLLPKLIPLYLVSLLPTSTSTCRFHPKIYSSTVRGARKQQFSLSSGWGRFVQTEWGRYLRT